MNARDEKDELQKMIDAADDKLDKNMPKLDTPELAMEPTLLISILINYKKTVIRKPKK